MSFTWCAFNSKIVTAIWLQTIFSFQKKRVIANTKSNQNQKPAQHNLPLEVWPSCLSGDGAKSEPIPDDPRDETTCLGLIVVLEAPMPEPTICWLRHLNKKEKVFQNRF